MKLILCLLLLPLASSQPLCGGTISIAGCSSVLRLAKTWREGYNKICPNQKIVIAEDGGSSDGAARLCGTRSGESVVDIGGMTRQWNRVEATSSAKDWRFDCERSTRKAIQVDVAIEGVSVATKSEGVAVDCVRKLGGLTIDQLRWIFSNLNEEQLKEEDWNQKSTPFSDGDDSTHLWSELHEECEAVEIKIAGTADDGSGPYDFLSDILFKGEGETIDGNRTDAYYSSSKAEKLVAYLEDNDSAVAFLGLSYVLENQNLDVLFPTPVVNAAGDIVKPSEAAFEDKKYPLSRRLFMNLFDDEKSLAKTRPFLDFGLGEQGTALLKAAGFMAIDDWQKVVMATRAQTVSGVSLSAIRSYCGPGDGDITIAGSSTVFPVAQIWSAIYQIGCNNIAITVEGGGSSAGAGRVCANEEEGSPVVIGDMSREWKETEATEASNGFLYDCLTGDTKRSAIQIDVAEDGLAVAVQDEGSAAECIQILGGLTIDQLRWIYSDYTDSQLEETGWDPKSLKNSDRDSSTHLWSELDDRCALAEIRIAGPDEESGTYEYFKEVVLKDHENGETFNVNRPVFGYVNSENDEQLVVYLRKYQEAISYFGFSYYYTNKDSIIAVPIKNKDGDFVAPTDESIGSGNYNPLARRIYMNLLNDANALEDTSPFVKFGLNSKGLVSTTGYIALPENDMKEMLARVDGAPYSGDGEGGSGLSTGAIIGIAIGGAVGFIVLISILFVWMRKRSSYFSSGAHAQEQAVEQANSKKRMDVCAPVSKV